MPRISTNQADVLEAVAARLREAIPEPQFTESTCFISIWPVPPEFPPHETWITVAPAGGQFDEGMHDGGGAEVTSEVTSVAVTVFTRCHLDDVSHSARILTEYTRGLLRLKREILRALSAHDLEWRGDQILRNLMCPLKSDPPGYNKEEGLGWITVHVSTDFDHNLTE